MALEMRQVCEKCGKALGLESEAYICSYECTFCGGCKEGFGSICPNCGGVLVLRPTRRKGT